MILCLFLAVIVASSSVSEAQMNPVIHVNQISDAGVSEATPVGTVVAVMNVEYVSETMCIIESPYFSMEQISENLYKIKVFENPDRERTNFISVRIICKDESQPDMYRASVMFFIKILDANDNPPKFIKSHYEIQIREGVPVGTVLLHAMASDLDVGENGRISYRLSPNAAGLVTIDADSGIVSSAVVYDSDGLNRFQFQVIAEDNGMPRLSSTASVRVQVVTSNNN